MGAGSFTHASYESYSCSVGKSYNSETKRVSGQVFRETHINPKLDPNKFQVRECLNTEEHPNTIPVILALDVTGSMGEACRETAEALGVIMADLYGKFKDIEFCVMGIGDLSYDSAPIQMSQFESDVRIAESLDKIYMEHGGGGNAFESYTAAWYMGLYRTKLDCFDKQGRKGIIITMGDEPMNPYLPASRLNSAISGAHEQDDVEMPALYRAVTRKFDVYHIAVNERCTCYGSYRARIEASFGQLLGNRLKVSTINNLSSAIVECITDSIDPGENGTADVPVSITSVNENGEIYW